MEVERVFVELGSRLHYTGYQQQSRNSCCHFFHICRRLDRVPRSLPEILTALALLSRLNPVPRSGGVLQMRLQIDIYVAPLA